MALTVERARANTKNLMDPLAREVWIIENRILGCGNFNEAIVYHVVKPYFSDQKKYDSFVLAVAAVFKRQGYIVGACKLTNKKGVLLTCLVLDWSIV
jgi:hypothetical protein